MQSDHCYLDRFEVFPWGSKFETGIEIIDQQHQVLVELLNELANALVHEDIAENLRIFDQLTDYAQYHFTTEEKIWKRYFSNDEWGSDHLQEHELFIANISKFEPDKNNPPSRDQLEEVMKFLISWLVTHILESDMRMAIATQLIDEGQDTEEAKKNANKQMRSAATFLIDAVLAMYDSLSTRTMELMRERVEHQKVEQKLIELNRDLEELSVTDQLTGLRNRRSFDEIFPRELRRARRNRSNLAFMMLDIDYFKRINDQYGHSAGDAALKAIGDKLNQLFRRPGDYAFRLGGEEFSVLITAPELIDGIHSAERVRLGIQSLHIPNRGSDTSNHLTVSVGMVNKVVEKSDDVESFLKLADNRLYQAKAEGRNRVIAS